MPNLSRTERRLDAMMRLARRMNSLAFDDWRRFRRMFNHANDEMGGSGIESLELRDGSIIEYVNMGDAYATTLVYHAGRVYVGSWGDLVVEIEAFANADARADENDYGQVGFEDSTARRRRL